MAERPRWGDRGVGATLLVGGAVGDATLAAQHEIRWLPIIVCGLLAAVGLYILLADFYGFWLPRQRERLTPEQRAERKFEEDLRTMANEAIERNAALKAAREATRWLIVHHLSPEIGAVFFLLRNTIESSMPVPCECQVLGPDGHWYKSSPDSGAGGPSERQVMYPTDFPQAPQRPIEAGLYQVRWMQQTFTRDLKVVGEQPIGHKHFFELERDHDAAASPALIALRDLKKQADEVSLDPTDVDAMLQWCVDASTAAREVDPTFEARAGDIPFTEEATRDPSRARFDLHRDALERTLEQAEAAALAPRVKDAE